MNKNLTVSYKLSDRFDFFIFVSSVLLAVIGLIGIASATVNHPTASGSFEKQLIWFFVALTGMLITYYLPLNFFRIGAWWVYLLSLFFLVLVLLLGKTVYGSKSWLYFGPIGFQPAEVGKIGLILSLAYFLGDNNRDVNKLKDLFLALLIGGVLILLIMGQPDLGTAIVYISIIITMIFWSGINLLTIFTVLFPFIVGIASLKHTFYFIGAIILCVAILYYFRKDLFFNAAILVINISAGFFSKFALGILKPHQQKRLQAFLDPGSDPLGYGYNALQAKVAIGSGGFWGKGFMQGNQTQLRFIPKQWTDFIYSVIGEEFGFFGSFILFLLFGIIFYRIIKLSKLTKDKFSSLILIGILTYLTVHFIINIGMNIGLMPVIGIPLPFVSYGGTSLVVNMFFIGLILNIYRNRKYQA